MRVLFAGTPEIAVPTLTAIHASSHELVGVLTAPDRPRGRGRKPARPVVADAAVELGPQSQSADRAIPVLQPETLRTQAREEVSRLEPGVLVCFAYGRIFGPRFLDLFPHGGLNVHPSLLPRYRGPAPIPAAILAGDAETGITVQRLALEMDTGDIVLQDPIALDGTETSSSLGRYVAERAGELVVRVLDALEAGTVEPRAQDHAAASYTRLVSKEDGEIDWTRPAAEIERMVRAYDPWPRAWTVMDGERLAILEAALAPEGRGNLASASAPGTILGVDKELGILVETGNGLLALQRLHLQSRKPLEWRSFVNGMQELAGTVLGGKSA